mmetsp:Transcript_175176/g.561801  ORF Transcript_175176/g.561801 Transcript_175176/m.561801 type:complete len:552 (+) Transcript_175176:72-1727(+)
MAGFYGEGFYQAVESAFDKIDPCLLQDCGSSATREKRRVREKIRLAGQALDAAHDLSGWSTDRLLTALAADALPRFMQSWPRWLEHVDWAVLLAAFVADAWPNRADPLAVLCAARTAVRTVLGAAGDVVCRVEAAWPADNCADVTLEAKLNLSDAQRRYMLQPARPESPSLAWLNAGSSAAPLPERPATEAGLPAARPVAAAAPAFSAAIERMPTLLSAKSKGLPSDEAARAVSKSTILSGFMKAMPLAAAGHVLKRPPPLDGEDAQLVAEYDIRVCSVVIQRLKAGAPIGATLNGKCVSGLAPGSPGAASLALGDNLVAVGGRAVVTQRELTFALEAARPGPIHLTVQRRVPCAALPAPEIGRWPAHRGDAVTHAGGGGPSDPARPTPGEPPSGERATSGATIDAPIIVLNADDILHSAAMATCFGVAFCWDAVLRAVSFYEDLGFVVQAICSRATLSRAPAPPRSLSERLVAIPVVDSVGSYTERLFALRMVQTYGCHFVDNTNFRCSRFAKDHEALWQWFSAAGGSALQVGYIFDTLGAFVPSRTVYP